MCCGSAKQPPTQLAARFVFALRVLCVLQVAIMVLNLISVKFVIEGIFCICLVHTLFSASRRL